MEGFSKIETTPIKRRIAIGLALMVGSLSLAACGSKASEAISKPSTVVSVSKAEQNCSTFENVDQSSHYLSNSAMPTSEKSIGKALNQNTAAEYVRSLFGAEGPLAAKGDIHTLAFIMSAVTIPAHEGNLAANGQMTNYNYFNQYSQQLDYFQSNPNSIAGACEQSLKTMIEDGQYTNDFAQKGQAVTLFQPERNQKGEVINYKPVKVIVGEVLNGVEFKARLLNQPGYTPVLITENGEVYVKGVVLENIPKPENQNKPTVTTVPQSQSEQIQREKHQTANKLVDSIEGLHTGMNDHKYIYGFDEIDEIILGRPTLVIGELVLESIHKILEKDFQDQHFIAIRVLHPLDKGIPEDFYLSVHTGRNDIPTVYDEKTRQDFNDLLQEEDKQRICVFKEVFPMSKIIDCLTDDQDFKILDGDLARSVKVIFDK